MSPALHERTNRWVRLVAPGERLPRAPRGYRAMQVGLTAHLRRESVTQTMVCGVQRGTSRPAGRPLGWCSTCWELAR